MTLPALALRHARVIALVAVALVVAGGLAAVSIPSSIYPPLQFPRIVVVARAGTLPPPSMSLVVTRPIEQVIMAVPGIRRVRSKSLRGAAEISAQFEPSTDMVVALQMVQNRIAEITGELPAGTELEVERMTPEIFPVFILSLTGALPIADLFDHANYVVKPAIARSDPRYYEALVANTVLGGGYSARLNSEIRIKRGLSYGARASLAARRTVGSVSAQAQTKNESAAEVAGLIRGEMAGLATRPPSPE